MIKFIPAFFAILLCFSCKTETQPKQLKVGTYRAVIAVQDDKELPFIFEVESPSKLRIFNAEEVIEVDEIEYRNDSVFIKTPVFQGLLAATFKGDNLQGQFIEEDRGRTADFSAEFNKTQRFPANEGPSADVSGVWETVFSKGSAENEYTAKGIFKQEGQKVTGTFRTKTGDYRYLDGVMDGNTMKLSTFDGAHAYLFTANVSDSALVGTFYSGKHWKEPFEAKRNEAFELPNADTLTFLKAGYDKLSFSFPDAQGNLVSLEDDRFKNKVVVVQIMGTWCPNCLDETKYFTKFYDANKDEDIEFVALAFEYAKTEEQAFERIARLRDRLDIRYPILLAQYGSSDKAKAQEKLPMLNHVLSYPTSIFIDKTGKVRKIHTGFNGPATGENYETFKREFEVFVEALLKE